MSAPPMSAFARRALEVGAAREGLPLDGWAHYATARAGDGYTFHYDRAEADTFGGLVLHASPRGYTLDEEASWLDLLREAVS